MIIDWSSQYYEPGQPMQLLAPIYIFTSTAAARPTGGGKEQHLVIGVVSDMSISSDIIIGGAY